MNNIKGTGVRLMKEAYAVVVQFVAFLLWIGTGGVFIFEAFKIFILHGDRSHIGWAAISAIAFLIMLEAGRIRKRIRKHGGKE